MQFRHTAPSDTEEVLAVYSAAKAFMDQSGNPDQWAPGYPSADTIRDDIVSGRGRVLEDGGEILVHLTLCRKPDPTYAVIREGAWPDSLPYATVHRIAARRQGQGLAGIALAYAEEEAAAAGFCRLRMDTYRDNLPMQRFLAHRGFVRCGIISLDGDFRRPERLRIAYVKTLTAGD